MGFFSDAFDWVTGSSFTANLAKTAALGYATRLLSDTTDDSDNDTSASSLGVVEDNGVRLQLDPNTQNKLPVLYGEAYFGGYLTDAEISPDYKKMTYCLSLAELTGDHLDSSPTTYNFKNVYLNNNRVIFKADGITVDHTVDSGGNEDISYRDLIKIYFYTSGPLQPDGSGGTTPPSYTIMPGWNITDNPMTGVMYAIVEVTYSRDKNVTALPQCIWNVKSNLTYPGDALNDYMQNTVYGGGIPASEIDGSLQTLNDYGIAGFSYTDANLQAQTGPISINGLIDTNKNVLSNMQALVKCVSSWVSYDINAGMWSVVINKQGSSVAHFDDGNIINDLNVSGTALTQLYNASDVKYQNTDILDKTDFVKIVMPPEDLYQNEPGSFQQISLPYTNKQAVAIKVGLLGLKQSRIDKVITFSADYSYINLKAGQLIDITNSVYGYTNKLFRIITTSEVDGEDGAIEVEFTCLEYNASVYTYDISEYNVETDDGILSIGSIGKPDTPLITNNFKNVDPHVLIKGKVPSGVVDRMEFLITHDTGIGNDADRIYDVIGAKVDTVNPTFEENEEVTYKYSTTNTGDMFIKVRGLNSVVTGPLSDPSGLIQYVPLQVADTVSDVQTELPGGEFSQLGLLSLLKLVDFLMRNDENPLEGIWDRIFNLFHADTGYDLVQEAKDGNIGPGVPGPPGPPGEDGGGMLPGQNPGDIPVWDGGEWQPQDPDATEPPDPGDLLFGFSYTCPSNKNSEDPEGGGGGPGYVVNAATIGDYVIQYTLLSETAIVLPGTGSAYLYKSDGTLVESFTASECTIDVCAVFIPFANRLPGTDYYILIDEGFTTQIGRDSLALTLDTDWYFTTIPRMEPGCIWPLPKDLTAAYFRDFWPQVFPGPDKCGVYDGNLEVIIEYSKWIEPGVGDLRIFNLTTNSVEASLPASGAIIQEKRFADFGFYNFKVFNDYQFQWDEGLFNTVELNSCGREYPEGENPGLPVAASPSNLGISGPLNAGVYVSDMVPPLNGVGNINLTSMELGFNEEIVPGDIQLQLNLYKDDGTLVESYGPADSRLTYDNTIPGGSLGELYVIDTLPRNGSINNFIDGNLYIVFNRRIEKGQGFFNLHRYDDDSLIQSFDINTTFDEDDTSSIINITDGWRTVDEKYGWHDTVYLDPTTWLEPGTDFYVLADEGVLLGECGETWSITDKDFYTLSTMPTTTVEILSVEPTGDDARVNTIEIELNGPVIESQGTKSLYVYKSTGELFEKILSTDSNVSIDNDEEN